MTPGIEAQALAMERCDPVDEDWARFAGAEPTVDVPADEPVETLADKLGALLLPWSNEEIQAAKIPWPHVFAAGERGIFPIGEVSIVGARGREGKTTILTAIATACAIGNTLVGLHAPATTTVIYSAEDDRQQYARKIGAQMSVLGDAQIEKVRNQILVPDLDHPSVAAARELVMVLDRQPMATSTVDAIIEALTPLLSAPAPLRMVVFETASTLSDAEEDNRGHKVLIAALKRIARTLGVAVVLIHHTSQQADNNLADLNVSTADIRGGTSLVFNGRQTWLLVNLGSDNDPFPDADARTVLRRMVCDGNLSEQQHRLLVLICLDSSKSAPVPPIFFKWLDTEYGPVAVDLEAPLNLIDRPWRKVHEMVRAQRSEQVGVIRAERKAERTSAVISERVQRVLTAVASLPGQQPITARRLRDVVGMSSTVLSQVLATAVADGHLISTTTEAKGNSTLAYSFPGVGHGFTGIQNVE